MHLLLPSISVHVIFVIPSLLFPICFTAMVQLFPCSALLFDLDLTTNPTTTASNLLAPLLSCSIFPFIVSIYIQICTTVSPCRPWRFLLSPCPHQQLSPLPRQRPSLRRHHYRHRMILLCLCDPVLHQPQQSKPPLRVFLSHIDNIMP
ncbi:hypothetical protein AAZX31_12G182800 [Glycine max]|nr:hypothetical protein GLYMA_12G193450v4 [Glycine max]KAH1143969.1 hypothetical protein GYH30_034272 [Glycine max]